VNRVRSSIAKTVRTAQGPAAAGRDGRGLPPGLTPGPGAPYKRRGFSGHLDGFSAASVHLGKAVPLTIASWNVNSIRARHDVALEWLEATRPDVLCLQETKVLDDIFPLLAFKGLGYDVATLGQKGYNGVAIAATAPLSSVKLGFDDPEYDEEGARVLGVEVAGVHVYSVYVPNGKVVGSPAYEKKLRWLERLRHLFETRHGVDAPLAVCGDFNVAADERDVHDPWFWKTQVLFHASAREALVQFCDSAFVDTFRLLHQEGGAYSWWDYRRGAFRKNEGLRIDYVLASQPLAKRCTAAWIDREPRKKENPSDHTPVLATFDVP
jgi:exodeoxyribonuclease-3